MLIMQVFLMLVYNDTIKIEILCEKICVFFKDIWRIKTKISNRWRYEQSNKPVDQQ